MTPREKFLKSSACDQKSSGREIHRPEKRAGEGQRDGVLQRAFLPSSLLYSLPSTPSCVIEVRYVRARRWVCKRRGIHINLCFAALSKRPHTTARFPAVAVHEIHFTPAAPHCSIVEKPFQSGRRQVLRVHQTNTARRAPWHRRKLPARSCRLARWDRLIPVPIHQLIRPAHLRREADVFFFPSRVAARADSGELRRLVFNRSTRIPRADARLTHGKFPRRFGVARFAMRSEFTKSAAVRPIIKTRHDSRAARPRRRGRSSCFARPV